MRTSRLRKLMLLATTLVTAALALVVGIGCLAAPVLAQDADAVAGDDESDALGDPFGDEDDDPMEDEAPDYLRSPAISSSDVEEIIITGGVSEGAQDFQAADSVASFDAGDLAALGAQDIADLAAFTPNLEIVTTGSTTPTFFIRGIGLNDFNANSSAAVSIYEDDVPRASQGLQLGALFDMQDVNILRGPQGTGPARNASAGAIKLYSRKPTGSLEAYLRSSFGNFRHREFEGAFETPILESLSARFAFRVRERDGIGRNGCGNAPPFDDRVRESFPDAPDQERSPLRICGEVVDDNSGVRVDGGAGLVSGIPVGLPSEVNNSDHWAARGMFLFEPLIQGFESSWLLKFQGSRRDEQSRLGQSIGTQGTLLLPDGSTQLGRFGNTDAGMSRDQDIIREEGGLFTKLAAPLLAGCRPTCTPAQIRLAQGQVRSQVQRQLKQNLADLDHDPFRGDYNHVGPTRNDVWGVSLRGDALLPEDVSFRTISAYDTYHRLVDVDLDFSPNTLFQIRTEDELYQFSQDFRFAGEAGDAVLLQWDAGGFYLRERLEVMIDNDLGDFAAFSIRGRDYVQETDHFGLYGSLALDLGWDFTLDGGFRYNWERKRMDYKFITTSQNRDVQTLTWDAPTGTIRLTYKFREDTHAYWKYSRGWKAGHFNATSSDSGITSAAPESLDAFEIGLRGTWFEGIVQVQAALFHYNYENYQIFTSQSSTGGIDFVVLNAKAVEVFGAEFRIDAQPWEWTELMVDVGWLESQFTDFVQLQETNLAGAGPGMGDIVLREVNNTGNRVLNSPRFKVSLMGKQTLPLGRAGRFGQLSLRYDAAWSDDVFYDGTEGRGIPSVENRTLLPENAIGQSSYWIHNLSLSYQVPSAAVMLTGWVRNLSNTEYKSYAFDGTTFQDTTIYFLGDPRTYGVSLEVRF